MTGKECEKLAKENNWSLARQNACHLAVQNEEQGELRDAQLIQNEKITKLSESFVVLEKKVDNNHFELLTKMNIVGWQSNIMFGIWSIIALTVGVWFLKKMLNNIKGE